MIIKEKSTTRLSLYHSTLNRFEIVVGILFSIAAFGLTYLEYQSVSKTLLDGRMGFVILIGIGLWVLQNRITVVADKTTNTLYYKRSRMLTSTSWQLGFEQIKAFDNTEKIRMNATNPFARNRAMYELYLIPKEGSAMFLGPDNTQNPLITPELYAVKSAGKELAEFIGVPFNFGSLAGMDPIKQLTQVLTQPLDIDQSTAQSWQQGAEALYEHHNDDPAEYEKNLGKDLKPAEPTNL